MSNRWNYQVVPFKPSLMGTFKPEEMQAELNRHGQQGWELVNIIVTAPMTPVQMVFKREA